MDMLLRNLFERKANGNASYIALQLTKKLKVNVTASTVIDTVEKHQDYPSLLSISDSLDDWQIDNMALQISPEQLEEMPTPFIAHSRKGHGSFVLVNSVNGSVNYLDEKGKAKTLSREDFVKSWSGAILLAEASQKSGEENYSASRKKELLDSLRIPFLIITSIGLIFLHMATHSVNAEWNLFFQLIKLAGVVVTALLLLYELDESTPLLRQICHASKKVNCNAVLGSKHAKLFNWLGWGEIGFFYFLGGFLFLLLGNSSTNVILSWLNLFALPYTVFSVLYQWRVVKQWCPLCLTVQFLLIAEGILCYFNYWKSYQYITVSTIDVIPFLVSFAVPVFFWTVTKKVYIGAKNGTQNEKELARIKYNKEIFNALLSKQKQAVTPADGLGIMLGNPDAANTIIKVCNPYCGPCAKAHPLLEELLAINDNIRVQIIFTATNDQNDIRMKPVKHLMALYEKNEPGLIQQALDEWYLEKRGYDDFAQKYPLNDELENQEATVIAMDKWCKETDITYTPTIFVNGYELPDIYKIEDLKHLL